jgi:proteasome component ECM29
LGNSGGGVNRTPASDAVKIKILNTLSKSREATASPYTKNILMDSLFAEFGNPKLKSAGMQFFIWVLTEGSEESSRDYAQELFVKLVETLERLMRSNEKTNEAEIMKENFYTALGSLAKKYPEFIRERFHLVTLYFKALTIESPQVKISVQQGLNNLISAYMPPSEEMQREFEDLFLKTVTAVKRDSHAISAALRGTNRLFPFDHAASRLMCLLCSDDSKLNVREESARGLDLERFTKYRQMDSKNQVFNYGKFSTFVEYVYHFYTTTEANQLTALLTPKVQENILKFTRENYEANKEVISEDVLDKYLHIINYSFTYTSDVPADLLYEGAESLLHLLALDLDRYGKKFAEKFHTILEKAVFAGDDRSREKVSKLFALLMLFLSEETRDRIVKSLSQILFTPPKESREKETHAAILLLGDIIAITFRRDGMNPYPDVSNEIVAKTLKFKELENVYASRQLVVVACYRAIGEMGRQNALSSETLSTLLTPLLADIQKNKNDKLVEIILQTIGMIVTGEEAEEHFTKIIDVLFELGVSNKSDEILFTIGEVLANMSGGAKYCTLYAQDPYSTIFSEHETKIDRNAVMTKVLTKIIREGVLHGKKIVRQCASIWLMSVVRFCKEHPRLKYHLKEVQRAFSTLLTDTNEITNEVAGRGLAYVYELGDTDIQNDLVNSLVDQLSGNEQRMDKKDIKLTDETEMTLFPENIKESKGTGGSGTYKELVDVANDIGKPEMIYQMLAVSSHNAIWNAKRAAAFSAVNIVNNSQSAEKLEQMLPTIIPKLYRYQFDPNPVINKSMTDMWKTLVKNPKQTIDQYLPGIMKELLAGVNSNLWRVREASCYALTDIYTGRRFVEMEPFIEQSCLKVFRVMDDIKDTGRKAANSAIKKIAAFCVKCCDPKYTDAADVRRALDIIIPVFLKEGLLFPLKDVVYLSIEQLHQIANVAGPHIRPFITDIVGTLLEQTSVLEPQMLNYIELNQQQYGITTEQVETLRMSMNRTGPIAETISSCERRIDEEVMVTLVPRVMDILRSGTGFGTRTAAARFVQQLAKFHGILIRKHTQAMLRTIMNVLLNSSGSSGERTVLASALPYVLKNSKMTQAEKVLQQVIDMYINEAANEGSRVVAGLLFEQMNQQAPVIIQKFYEKVLPAIFIARHDPEEKVRKIWREQVWDEIVSHSSTKDFIRLFVKPITTQCLALMSHASWQMKKQGGQALHEIAESIPEDIPQDVRIQVANSLMENIPGRLWEGKFVLLDAFGALLKPLKTPFSTELNADPVVLLAKECRRQNLLHREHALVALRQVLSSPVYNRSINAEKYNDMKEMTETIKNEKIENDDEKDEKELLERAKKREKVSAQLNELQSYIFNNEAPTEEQLQGLRDFILQQLESRQSQQENIAILHTLARYAEMKPLDKQLVTELARQSDAAERQANIREVALILLQKVVEKKQYEGVDISDLQLIVADLKEREKDKKLSDRVASLAKSVSHT